MDLTIESRVTRIETIIERLATKEDISNLRTEISNLETRMIKYLVSLVITNIGTVVLIIYFAKNWFFTQ